MAAGQLAIVGAIFVVGWIAVATVQNVPVQHRVGSNPKVSTL
jgi:hypothetical protein